LLQDDSNKNSAAQIEKIIDRITLLEDLYQTLKDVIDLTNDTNETHLKELMNWTHDYLSNLERITGHNKTGN
jgi:mevalonate kinase